jgi:hypothetical protein
MKDLLDPTPEDGPGRPAHATGGLARHPPASVPALDGAAVAAFATFYRAQTPALVRFLVWMARDFPTPLTSPRTP